MAKSATFGVKWASDESFCPSTLVWWSHGEFSPTLGVQNTVF